MACQYSVPIIVVIVNNGYLGLIRPNQQHYGFEYGVEKLAQVEVRNYFPFIFYFILGMAYLPTI